LKRVLRAIKSSGTPLPPWASDIDLDDRSANGARRVDPESLRRLVYRAALEAYRRYARPVKAKEVEGELARLSVYVGIEPPRRATVAKLLRQLASRDHYGCEPPLLKVEDGYVPKEACQEKFNTLDYFFA